MPSFIIEDEEFFLSPYFPDIWKIKLPSTYLNLSSLIFIIGDFSSTKIEPRERFLSLQILYSIGLFESSEERDISSSQGRTNSFLILS